MADLRALLDTLARATAARDALIAPAAHRTLAEWDAIALAHDAVRDAHDALQIAAVEALPGWLAEREWAAQLARDVLAHGLADHSTLERRGLALRLSALAARKV